MDLKKNPKVDLERNRNIYLQIGFAVVFGVFLVIFNWTSREKTISDLGQAVGIDLEEEMIATERNEQIEPPPPPPPQESVIEELIIVENTVQETKIDFTSEATDKTEVVQREIQIKVEEEEVYVEPEVFIVVEEAPEFPGGIEAMMKFINSNIKYPQVAKENNISGRVFLNFVVDDKGNITKIKILSSVDPALDAEAIRVVQSMPRWKPGKQRGKPVHVSFNLPIMFRLQ